MTVYIIGIGGIGSNLVDPVCRILYSGAHADNHKLHLIDGDSYEVRNIGRQHIFSDGIGMNKAEYHATRLRRAANIPVIATSEFLTPSNIKKIFVDKSSYPIVLACVDQHASRKLIQDHLREVFYDSLLISGGNELTTGDVLICCRMGRYTTNGIDMYHQEIRYPTDRRPDQVGCEMQIAAGETQLISTNFMVAAWMLVAFERFIRYFRNCEAKPPIIDEILFDLDAMKAGTITRPLIDVPLFEKDQKPETPVAAKLGETIVF